MKYVNYNIKKHDSHLVAHYLRKSLQQLFVHMQNIFFRALNFILPNKFARFIMLLPMTFILLSGFIHEEEPPFSKTIPMIADHRYPLVEDYRPSIYAPQSGMIPMTHEISSFFTQYAPHDVPGYLYEHNKNELQNYSTLTQEFVLSSLEQKAVNTNQEQALPSVILEDKYAKTPDIHLTLPKKQLDPHNAPKSYASRKNSYAPIIYKYAKKYNLDPKLVISIVYAESMFMPHLVSSKNAHGLMQVVPETAGAEVNRFFKKEGIPSVSDLIHPETNIRYGTAYLYLLRRYHLTGIHNARSKDLITIASYNAGSGAVLRHFGPTKMQAIENINNMTPDEIYENILFSFRSAETRRYLAKVTGHMDIL